MQDIPDGSRVPVWCAAVFLVVMPVTDAFAKSACPAYVELPSGSAFDIAHLVKDAGSPEAALGKVRDALARIDANGGCPHSVRPLVCQETVAVARKAMAALQACSSSFSALPPVQQNTRDAAR